MEFLAGNRIIGTSIERVSLVNNIQDGCVFYEKDTNKEFVFDSSSVGDLDFASSSSAGVNNQPTDNSEAGQYITSTTHRGKKAKSATFYVQRVGNPSGTMKYLIRNAATPFRVLAESTGMLASDISTSTTAVTLYFNNEGIPNNDIRVTVSGVSGSSGNVVGIKGGGSDVVSGQQLTTLSGSSWSNHANDCAGKLTFSPWTEV